MAKLTPLAADSVREQAEAAKQKGNEHFKKGEYAESIGCYSHAHILFPSSPIYPLNRAQAYINLSKFEDAERDCSTSISLDPKNAKGWFRRAIARRELGDWDGSKGDFKRVLGLDRGMESSVKVELGKVEVAEKKEREEAKGKARQINIPSIPSKALVDRPSSSLTDPVPKPTVAPTQKTSPPPASPIQLPTPTPSIIKPIPIPKQTASPPTKPTAKDPTASIFPTFPSKPKPKPTPAAPSGFLGLKAARSAKPAIPKISPVRDRAFEEDGVEEKRPIPIPVPRPSSVYELTKALKALDHNTAWIMLKELPLSNLTEIIGSSLEPPLLGQLFDLLETSTPEEDGTRVELVRVLGGVKRLGLNVCMLDRGTERWAKIQRSS